jgi:hypothetical protein
VSTIGSGVTSAVQSLRTMFSQSAAKFTEEGSTATTVAPSFAAISE